VETGSLRELRPNLGDYFFGPLWSPDGSWLTVDGYDKKGQWGICRIDLQNGDATPLLISEPGQDTHEAALAWSVDGKALYFARWLNDGKGTEAVIAYDMQTGKDKEIVRGTPDAVAVSPKPTPHAAFPPF
jgi:Tol biopolymer transport system component